MALSSRPRGTSPIDYARAGRWWLGRCEHHKALRRHLSVPAKSPRCLADAIALAIWPWTCASYPGRARALSEVLAIKLRTAEGLLGGHDRLPLHHARRLISFLEGRLAIQQALLVQLREAADREERARAMRPHAGAATLARWRREQALAKAAAAREGKAR